MVIRMNARCLIGLFRTVFVITDQIPRFRSTFVALSCILAVLGLLLLALLKLRGRSLRIVAAIVLPILLAFCSFWYISGDLRAFEYSLHADDYKNAVLQYRSGDYQTAEGVASGGRYTHEGGFCFLAGSTQICTSPYFKEVGYHRNGTSPFILENGMRVKVYYDDGTILRIDQLE